MKMTSLRRLHGVLLLLTAFSSHSFTIHTRWSRQLDSYRSTVVTALASSSNTSPNGADDAARAGTEGYSVLRQPARWDPDAEPEFKVPTLLDESLEQQQRMDDDWWSASTASIKKKRMGGDSTEQSASSAVNALDDTSAPSSSSSEHEKTELNLFQRTLDTLDFPQVLNALHARCTTASARKRVKEAIHIMSDTRKSSSKKTQRKVLKGMERADQPLVASTVEGSQERYRAVKEMQWLLGDDKEVNLGSVTYKNRKGYKERLAGPPLMTSNAVLDLDVILLAVDQGKVLDSEELMEISALLDAQENVQCWSEGLQNVEQVEFIELSRLANCISVNATLQELLHKAFDKNGKISGDAFPAVGRLRAQVRLLKESIMGIMDSLVVMPSIQSKLATESGGALISEVSGGRLVLPVDTKYASSIGIVHDSSRSGKTAYVEPTEVVGPTNELRQVESELRAEEARVWRLLTAEVARNKLQLTTSDCAMGQLDLVLARVLLGRKLAGTIPLVESEGVISLEEAKHPVLLLRDIDVVPSDVTLGADGNQGLVLTGPNSGGKTVILKLLGLMALMARSGIPVPSAAASARVDFFDPVLADIGDIQSVDGDLSTFSGHMLVCREVLANSGKNALVLMDELGSGTDPAQGVAIAQAILEALVDTGARCAITTHYMQLKQLAASNERFSVGGMQFVGGRPTYKLLPGTVGESFALAVAERLELPRSVIDRSTELLDSETRQMGDLIRELEDQKNIVDEQALELEEKRKELARADMEMKEKMIQLEKKQLNARRDEAKKFAAKLEEKERVLEDILNKLKSDPSRKVVAKSWDEVKFVKRDALNEAENVPSVMKRKAQAAAAADDMRAELVPVAEMREKPDLKEGDKIVVCKKGALLGRDGTVLRSLGSRVEVRVNNMNIGLKLSEVAIPAGTASVQTQSQEPRNGKSSISKAAAKAIESERGGSGSDNEGWQSMSKQVAEKPKAGGVTIRTQSNTVDVRGLNLQAAQEKIKDKFSTALMANRPVVYILHGYGTGGVLRTKIRNWLRTEKLAKRYKPADASDGGDSFTRVELRQ